MRSPASGAASPPPACPSATWATRTSSRSAPASSSSASTPGLLKDRVSVEFTYYNKLTKDALIERNIAPSLGASEFQFFNLSRIRNRGFELAINTRVLDSRSLTWDLSLSGSTTQQQDSRAGRRA